MPKKHILVVEDDEDIQELVSFNLSKEGYSVDQALTGEDALKAVKVHAPDCILLDLMLPGVDGLEICRRLKGSEDTRDIPVIMITAKGEESDIVVGLEMGADDYLTKPFSPKVLMARLRALFRRTSSAAAETNVLHRQRLTIDTTRHEVLVDGKPIELTATEFQVLHFLARKPGWVFTRQQIVDSVKGDDYPVTERSVDVQMVGLRRKLGDISSYIETVRGIGYRFKE